MHMATRLSTTLSVFLLTAACLSGGGQSTNADVPEIDSPTSGGPTPEGPGEDGSDASGPNVSGPISIFRSGSQAEGQSTISALIGDDDIGTRGGSNSPTGGFEFIVGQSPDTEDLIALATFYPGAFSEPGGGPTSGTVRYRGDFFLSHITGIGSDVDGSSSARQENLVNGRVNLNVAFDDGAFTGTSLSSSAVGETLALDGQIDRTGAMNGTATFAGVTADLEGAVFGDTLSTNSTAVGAFAGSTETEAIVGGFKADNSN
ncbi:hypothetical protein [Cognatiyoonia sp. IB215182]|uniref:hypothetical protein n=1 Tax=Cognatiyoonia sp. IB215182 TaxID=3097353 RepID=UPI002A23FF1B|nr:hypothetical protein [Cognatiyoonia sp. IB215182]